MPRNYRIKSAIYRRRKKQRAARDKNRTRRGGEGKVGARAFVSQDKPKDKNVLNGTSVFCLLVGARRKEKYEEEKREIMG